MKKNLFFSQNKSDILKFQINPSVIVLTDNNSTFSGGCLDLLKLKTLSTMHSIAWVRLNVLKNISNAFTNGIGSPVTADSVAWAEAEHKNPIISLRVMTLYGPSLRVIVLYIPCS